MIEPAPQPATRRHDPWDMLPDESSRAYQAFLQYRDTPPNERSILKIASAIAGRQLSKIPGHVGRWSTEHHWTQRAKAWDGEKERLADLDFLERRKGVARRQAQVADLLVRRGLEALRQITVDELTPRDVVAFIVEGTKLQRLAFGLSADDPLVGDSLPLEDFTRKVRAAMSDPGKLAALDEIAKRFEEEILEGEVIEDTTVAPTTESLEPPDPEEQHGG